MMKLKVQRYSLLVCPVTILASRLLLTQRHVDKWSLVNQLLIKNGWFWTTVVTTVCVLRYSRNYADTVRKYSVLSLWWFLFTQDNMFSNHAIMDLIFVWTGGKCDGGSTSSKLLKSSKHCKKIGGNWINGHDPSGHIFLLSIMTTFMINEFSKIRRVSMTQLRQDFVETDWNLDRQLPVKIILFISNNPVIIMLSFILLWWHSLVITSINYYHTLSEQLSGLLFAYIIMGPLYLFLPS
ncbi:hypothetical protein KAFR_0A04640 [Kazachstania africana CBS 2517]|uniref:Uncharacterized protein n=1 Tax=Kazachstania africana (strain ATCC 22294 / BCRC 22015 / CBS 2517 / CECT 1963 / NBRC 1671 / NRRL Y-8276) TaxID=1071382 RepID=H2ANE9_KAZAF|nr:hypothetical protein KAFR_0A04640 [Kazachstania africana CBS 2517]CCF55899.1 hypothetical protein KAFR_0A04640 [Kazachstania africana CBS 2517]